MEFQGVALEGVGSVTQEEAEDVSALDGSMMTTEQRVQYIENVVSAGDDDDDNDDKYSYKPRHPQLKRRARRHPRDIEVSVSGPQHSEVKKIYDQVTLFAPSVSEENREMAKYSLLFADVAATRLVNKTSEGIFHWYREYHRNLNVLGWALLSENHERHFFDDGHIESEVGEAFLDLMLRLVSRKLTGSAEDNAALLADITDVIGAIRNSSVSFARKTVRKYEKDSFTVGVVTQAESGEPLLDLFAFETDISLSSWSVFWIRKIDERYEVEVSSKKLVGNQHFYRQVKPHLEARLTRRAEAHITDVFADLDEA